MVSQNLAAMYAESFPRQSHHKSSDVEQDLNPALSSISFPDSGRVSCKTLTFGGSSSQTLRLAESEYLQFEEQARLNSTERDGHIGLQVQTFINPASTSSSWCKCHPMLPAIQIRAIPARVLSQPLSP